MRTGKFLLHEENAALLGCVYMEKRGDRMYVGLLSVAKEHQGKGLGRKLMKAAEKFAMEQGCITVDLRIISARTDIQPFYERCGYSVIGREQAASSIPARVPFHFVIMSKSLAPQEAQ